MFVLNPVQVRNKVFFYQEHTVNEDNEDVLVPYVLVRDSFGWDRILASDLNEDNYGNKIITMQSKKTEKDYYWYLKDIVYIQLNGEIPEGYGVRQLEPNKYNPHNFVLRKLNNDYRDGNVTVLADE